ncbi:MAG: ATP-dependent DNA helicase RecG [Lachnospiraceae bacterium]|nr:ATP-dependent DNA helicase RecG [Lachnospiraceae bacterium]
MKWNDPITELKGIGPKSAEAYRRLRIETVGDLLSWFPKKYDTFEPEQPIDSVREGRLVTVLGTFSGTPRVITTGKGMTILTATFRDSTGAILVKWFNAPFLRKQITQAKYVLLRGKVSHDRSALCLMQPEMYSPQRYREMMKTLRPVYGLTAGLSKSAVGKAVAEALRLCEISDPMTPAMRRELGLWNLRDAYEEVHFPKSEETTKDAIRRLAFDEFFRFLVGIRSVKEQTEAIPNRYPAVTHAYADRIIASLSYELTGAQKRCFSEITEDLRGASPMQRLLQGDVGSGKTVIAELALATIVEAGHQGCLMVPTEVLAKQHFAELTRRFEPLGIAVGLLTGSMSAGEKRAARESVASGETRILVGTHALFQQSVEIPDLGLVVVDEQHRFGVEQRAKLTEKGTMPHVLLMSATPIPRTLAMMLYADLDISVLDEMPGDRLRIRTAVVDTSYRPKAWKFLADHVRAGEQCYVICPLIEESDGLEASNVTDYKEMLEEALPDIRIGLLHGRMSASSKNEVMEAFADHQYDILVSTTVIEVGIDVSNATVILIEDAERFGLATLHQLRGRVGRGSKQSYCILVQGSDSDEAHERLTVLQTATDGFAIAEKDLSMRGPGDFFGIRQSGDNVFRIADPIRDAEVLTLAKRTVDGLTPEQYRKAVKLCLADKQENVIY